MYKLQRFPRLGAFFALTLLLAACGGGGGGASTAPVATPPPDSQIPDTGTVGVIITDASTEDFDRILATITSIELRGDDADAVIFSGEETIDLLELESFTELFAVADGVPAGDYNKIRLRLSELSLVRTDDMGNAIETINVALPGNGKVDLNPRQTFFVMPGSTLLLELDIDAHKSIKVTGTGNGTRYNFRPVVFVKIQEADDVARLARLHGTVEEIDDTTGEFVLCQTDFVSDPDDEDSDAHDDGQCLTVVSGEETGVFGADGEPADLSTLMVGDALTAIGTLRVSDESTAGGSGDSDSESDSDGDSDSDGSDDDGDSDSDSESDSDGDSDSDSDAGFDDDDLILDAAVIELGPLGTFERLEGVLTSDFDAATGTFTLMLDDGQGFGDDSAVTALLQDGARVFDMDGMALDESALVEGAEGVFDGVLMLSDTDPATLKTVLAVLDTPDDAPDTLSGTILSVDPMGLSLMLSTDMGDRCVDVTDDADITLVTITDDGTDSDTVGLDALMAGMTAQLFGMEDVGGCFLADTIRAELDNSTGVNMAPIAEAGPDQDAVVGDTVMLDGTSSMDPDGDILGFAWTLSAPMGSAAALSDAMVAMPTFVADVAGTYEAQLVVNDGLEDSAPDSVTIMVTEIALLDGEALYAASCATCHGTLDMTDVGGASAASIQEAIDNNTGNMGSLDVLSGDEVAAIAAALEGR